jgi:hypothetical protein
MTVPTQPPGGLGELTILRQKQQENHSPVIVRYRRDSVVCLFCGRMTGNKHHSPFQCNNDRMLTDKELSLIFEKRHLKCLSCDKVLTEPSMIYLVTQGVLANASEDVWQRDLCIRR